MDGARSLLRGGWALLALALVLRVVQILATRHWVPVSDPADYVRHAVSIAHTHAMAPSLVAHAGPSAIRPPAYPYFLGGVFALSGDSLTAGRLASALLGVVAVFLAGLVAQMLWGRRAGLFALGIAAVYPPFVLLSGTLLSESLALPIVLALLALVIAHRSEPRPRWVAPVAGLLFALALLDRPALVMFGLPVIVCLWGRPWRRWRAVRAPLIALVVAALAIVPWTIRNARDFHAFVPISTQSGFLLAGTYNEVSQHDPRDPGAYRPATFAPSLRPILSDPSLDENQMSRKLSKAGRDYATDHPGYVPEVFGLNGLRLLGLYTPVRGAKAAYLFQGIGPRYATVALVGWYVLALLAIAGLVRAARRMPWWMLVTPVLLYVSVIGISGDIRYRAPVELFAVWAAALALTGTRPAQPQQPTTPPRR